jgi:hypothetical protein
MSDSGNEPARTSMQSARANEAGAVRRVVDVTGRRWIVRHEPADVVMNSWGWVLPWPLSEFVLFRDHWRKCNTLVIYADASDGTQHRIEVADRHEPRDAVALVVSMIERGETVPERIDA